MRRCLNPKLSRSAIHRCLKRHAISARQHPDKTPVAVFHTDRPAGFIHIDVKYLPPLHRQRRYTYVAIDRATRFVYLEVLRDRRGHNAAGFLDRTPQNRAAHHRRFRDNAERDAYFHAFVADYNRTRLRCLNYQAPAEVLVQFSQDKTLAPGMRR